jgi:hypothetical protein
VRTGACAVAVTSAATTGELADVPEAVAAADAGASEYVSVMTGTRRRISCRRVTTTRCLTPRLLRTVVVDAEWNAGAAVARSG